MMTAVKCAGCDTQFVPKNKNNKYCSADCRKGVKEEAPVVTREYTLTDTSNPLLALGPSALSCGIVATDEGNRLIVTVRTSSATVTVGLTGKEASAWLAEFAYRVRDLQDAEEEPADPEPGDQA